MGRNLFNCWYSVKTKKILTYDYDKKKAVLLDQHFNVINTSYFTSYFQLATLEINNTLLYSMRDERDVNSYYLALVDSDNLHLLHQVKTYPAFCLTRLDETHVIVGYLFGYLTIFGITSNTIE